MTASDHMKIMRAGFQILRRDYQNLAIKQITAEHYNWRHFQTGFKSKAELDRRMKKLLEMELIVED